MSAKNIALKLRSGADFTGSINLNGINIQVIYRDFSHISFVTFSNLYLRIAGSAPIAPLLKQGTTFIRHRLENAISSHIFLNF
ncbi:MAG: hypothetical protein ABJA71_06820 [Ginsengibacter sp.]